MTIDDVQASEHVIWALVLRVGDSTWLLEATVQGITDGKWHLTQVLGGWAESSSESSRKRYPTVYSVGQCWQSKTWREELNSGAWPNCSEEFCVQPPGYSFVILYIWDALNISVCRCNRQNHMDDAYRYFKTYPIHLCWLCGECQQSQGGNTQVASVNSPSNWLVVRLQYAIWADVELIGVQWSCVH